MESNLERIFYHILNRTTDTNSDIVEYECKMDYLIFRFGFGYLEGVWESSAPPKTASLHKKNTQTSQPTSLHFKKNWLHSRFFGSFSRDAPPNSRPGGVG